jgi:NAD(P)-dependent dehydrogenase (short-subunit alcohol dehydrogenase family)
MRMFVSWRKWHDAAIVLRDGTDFTFGRDDDIAIPVSFVASPLAGFINGANLRVDGGGVQTVNQAFRRWRPGPNLKVN